MNVLGRKKVLAVVLGKNSAAVLDDRKEVSAGAV